MASVVSMNFSVTSTVHTHVAVAKFGYAKICKAMASFLKTVKPVGRRSGMVHITMQQPSKFIFGHISSTMKTDNSLISLRRAHFNPRKRGRKAKTEAEKRGGKGGGNWPAMDYLKDRWMREIEEAVDETSPPVDFDGNAAADAEDEQQGEQVVSTTDQPCPSSVSLSPDAYCSNIGWHESLLPFTTDYLTNASYDLAAEISPTSCYSFDSQAFASPEMESFVKPEDIQTQHATFYPDHCCPEEWSQ
jgi:hypothetical protein